MTTTAAASTKKRRRHGRIYSGTPSRLMREARIRATGSPELRHALAAGTITLYRAGEICKLPTHEQELAIAQWVNRTLLRTEAQAIAAHVIREQLARSTNVDLDAVSAAIREHLAKVRSP